MHPIFCAHLIIFLGLLNLDVIRSTPPLECLHCLHNDCSHIEDVHRRHRSRAEFGLVSIAIILNSQSLVLYLKNIEVKILTPHKLDNNYLNNILGVIAQCSN